MGYDPIWEPFFVYYEDTLICYYSDETVPGDNGGQILVYKTSADGGASWSDTTTIVDTNARPGMPVVSQMANGQWILTYETVGWNPIKAGYKIADNPFDWENVSEWGDTLPGIIGTYGGSPYVYTLDDGRIVAGTGSLSEVFVNTREDGTGEWIACATGAPAGYNRCYLQLSTGEFVIAGTEGSGFAGQGNKIFVKVMDPDEVFSAVPTFDSISVTGPNITEYEPGDELDLTGLFVMANYSDGSSREINSNAYTVSGYDADTSGEQVITVSYAGKTAEFKVTVAGETDEPGEGGQTGEGEKPDGDDPAADDKNPGSGDQEAGGGEPAGSNPDNGANSTKTDSDVQTSDNGNNVDSNTPQTGDNTNILPYAVMAAAALAAAGYAIARRKKVR